MKAISQLKLYLSPHFENYTVTIMSWLTVIGYLFHKWPRIWSTCPKHFLVLSSYTTYYRVCNYINTTGGTSGAGTLTFLDHLSSTPVFSYSICSFICMLCRSLLVLCTFIFKPLYCLSCNLLASDYLFEIFKLFLLSRFRINIWNDTGIESIICPVLRVRTEHYAYSYLYDIS